MGKNDAPKAPAGWYPIQEGKPGEQYWDGSSWTGETRGIPEPTLDEIQEPLAKKKLSKKTFFVGLVTALGIAALVITFAISSNPSKVLVPDVENLTQSEAIEAVEKAGLVATIKEEFSPRGQKAGIAFSSDPGPNSMVLPGSEVIILISSGEQPGEDLFSTWEDPFDSGNSSTSAWQPAGYSVFNEDLAFIWVEGGPDPCGSISCRYFTMDVISHFGCPNGVYVEMNMTSGGVVVDWSNDTVPALSAGQTAQLQFVTYDESVDSGQVTNMSCN